MQVRGRCLKVWVVKLDSVRGDRSLLSRSERIQAGRLKQARDRERLLETHCAVRSILGLQLGVSPRSLEFDTTPSGKPLLAKPVQDIEFNLSHSGPYALIAVAKNRSVGADIEILRTINDLSQVAFQVATPREAWLLRQLPANQVHSAFFDLWTRKEALLKALGKGFRIDAREVEVGIGRDRSYVNFDSQTWTIESLSIGSDARAAVAIEGKFYAPIVVSSF